MTRPQHPNSTLTLVCGMIGAGKTTTARQIEADTRALRLSPDEWLLELVADPDRRDLLDQYRDAVQRLQWQTAMEVLERGTDVVLEFGFWHRAERASYRDQARAAGHRVELIWMDAPPAVLEARIARRTAAGGPGVIPVEPQELYQWLPVFEPPDSAEQRTYEHFERRQPTAKELSTVMPD